MFVLDEILRYENYDLDNIVTPLTVVLLEQLLRQSDYDDQETNFLVDGFTNGFDIGYKGPKVRQSRSKNIPLTVGSKADLWNKLMKEVKERWVAGPYEEIPFDNYIQSPIGLVPKAGNKTRLIFHLSFDFGDGADEVSLNGTTPREDCTVHYNDLDTAVKYCLQVAEEAAHVIGQKIMYLGKTDLSSTFRVLPLKIRCICWLVMMAKDLLGGDKWKFFVDKCLPFRASISCSHYQWF